MKDLQKEFIPYDRALRMKALGFDEPCFAFYICKGHPVMIDEIRNGKCFDSDESEGCLAPTFSQAFRWIYDNHKDIEEIEISFLEMTAFNILYDEYRRLSCLDKLLEIVEQKQST